MRLKPDPSIAQWKSACLEYVKLQVQFLEKRERKIFKKICAQLATPTAFSFLPSGRLLTLIKGQQKTNRKYR